MRVLGHQTQVLRLGASTFPQPPQRPAPNLLIPSLRLQSVMKMDHHLCEMQSADLGAGKQQGFGALGLGLGRFSTSVPSVCEQKAKVDGLTGAGSCNTGVREHT